MAKPKIITEEHSIFLQTVNKEEIACKSVELAYSRNEDCPDALLLELMDVRAADNILVRYDFERDGWVIMQNQRSYDPLVSDTPDLDNWQEVSFIDSWYE